MSMPPETFSGLDWPFSQPTKLREKKLAASAVIEVTPCLRPPYPARAHTPPSLPIPKGESRHRLPDLSDLPIDQHPTSPSPVGHELRKRGIAERFPTVAETKRREVQLLSRKVQRPGRQGAGPGSRDARLQAADSTVRPGP